MSNINERKNKIWELLGEGRESEAFSAARQLDTEYPDSVNYILGACFANGLGTEENSAKAMEFLKKAVHTETDLDDVADAWVLGGTMFMNEEMYQEAEEWLLEAEKLGKNEATAYLGMVYASAGIDMRNAACDTPDPQEYAETNEVAVDFVLQSLQKYFNCLNKAPGEMNLDHCILFGRMCEMMVYMASRGELALNSEGTGTFSDMIGNAIRMERSKASGKDREEWFETAVVACEGIEAVGQIAIAELVRASCNICVSNLTHSFEAYFRADWHLMRAADYLNHMDAEEREQVMTTFEDTYKLFGVLRKKYNHMAESKMKNGIHPDISCSYSYGEAPDVLSCKIYTDKLNALHTTTSSKGGIFGALKNLFGKE